MNTVSDEDVLRAFESRHDGLGYIILTTGDVAEAVGCDEDAARQRLKALANRKEIVHAEDLGWQYPAHRGRRGG